jgi:glycosyltransferase involved in cell wall biosynthesis
MSGRPVVVAWARFQPRSVELARELDGEVRFVDGHGPAPIRYLAAAARTWGLLRRRRPRLVLAVSPPVFAPLVAWLWCLLHGVELVVDCHAPGSLDAPRWRWARPLHRVLLHRCRVALVHTRPNEALLEGWGAPVLLLTDDVPEVPSPPDGQRGDVLVAGSLDGNEPVATALAAAALLPHLRFAFTGDPVRLSRGVAESAPPNVTFTGYLAYGEFLAAVADAAAVAVFTDDPGVHTPRAAFEAVGAGRPLVLLDFPGTRSTFGSAAVFARREPEAMAAAVERAVAEREVLAERSRALAGRLRERRSEGLARLRAALSPPPAPGGRVLVLTQHSLERHCIARRNVEELLGRGFDVDVVCTEGLASPAAAGEGGCLRTFVIPIAHRRGGLAGYLMEYAAFFAGTLALVSWLGLRVRYVLVQSDNLPDSLVFAAVVPRLRGARVVFNMFELTPEMIDAGVSGRLGRLVSRLARRVEAAAVGWADRVIVVSEACWDALHARGAPPDKLAIVVNTTSWTGLPAADDAVAGDPDGGYLVTHGTLVERYGTHLILEAVARLPVPEARLRVVGSGEQLPELIDLAHELGIDGRVHFTGQLPWGETLAQVRGAAVGIVAVLEDGYGQLLLPTKLLEYARLGVPAVCPRLAAIEAYFPPSAVAYFRPGDPADLAAQVERLLRDPDLARGQALRAREVVDTLSWERMRDRYVEALGLGGPFD